MKPLILFFIIVIPFTSWTQRAEVIANDYSHFTIGKNEEKIDFVVASPQFSETKPILLFCQGSQPVPLFADFGDRGMYALPLNNFDLENMKKHFYVVVISMPFTPVKVTPKNLNRSYCYVLDTADNESFDHRFLLADNLNNHVNRANKVIEFLRHQDWVDSDKIVVAGHSQGARVAVGISSSNNSVTHLGLFGYNPLRRIDQLVWQQRNLADIGQITWDEADSTQQAIYKFYAEIQNPDSIKNHPEYTSWKSFSVSSQLEVAQLKIPVYIAYGSNDEIAQFCDQLPLNFIEQNKTNYVLKRYPNLDHNFFPKLPDGRIDRKNGKWKFVMNAFVDWSHN